MKRITAEYEKISHLSDRDTKHLYLHTCQVSCQEEEEEEEEKEEEEGEKEEKKKRRRKKCMNSVAGACIVKKV